MSMFIGEALAGDGNEIAHIDLLIGDKTGPGFAYDEIVPAIERIVYAYLNHRNDPAETFLAAYRRLGMEPFKSALYDAAGDRDAA